MSDTKSPLYALSKDTTNSLNSMLDNKHAHVLDTYYFFPLLSTFKQIQNLLLPIVIFDQKNCLLLVGGGWIGSFFKKSSLIYQLSTFQSTSCDFVSPDVCSFCLLVHLSLCLSETLTSAICFFNMKTHYIRQNEDQGQSSNEWSLPKVMFSFIYVYSSLQQRYFDIFYLFRTPFSVSKYKCVQMDAT